METCTCQMGLVWVDFVFYSKKNIRILYVLINNGFQTNVSICVFRLSFPTPRKRWAIIKFFLALIRICALFLSIIRRMRHRKIVRYLRKMMWTWKPFFTYSGFPFLGQ
jgi:hypothetical protein